MNVHSSRVQAVLLRIVRRMHSVMLSVFTRALSISISLLAMMRSPAVDVLATSPASLCSNRAQHSREVDLIRAHRGVKESSGRAPNSTHKPT